MKATQETADLPGSWGTLVTVRLGLRPRWDRHARPYGVSARPPLLPTAKAPDEQKDFGARYPGFRSDCLRFVVRVAPPHARLASGCWPALPDGICTRRVPAESFRVVVVTSLPLSPGFAWRNGNFFGSAYVERKARLRKPGYTHSPCRSGATHAPQPNLVRRCPLGADARSFRAALPGSGRRCQRGTRWPDHQRQRGEGP